MKRLFLLLAVCALVLPSLQTTRAADADVSIDFFYNNLNGGNWYEVSDYGYVWQPEAATDPNWRPYTDGYWAYTDQGWTWVSYEDFGWATYHYGRWVRLEDYGWVWVPGNDWAPAWVSWRTGGDYVGWAPLPPAGPSGEIVYESQPITGHVDLEFGIGPAFYNFVDMRYIGEPVLRDRILPWDRNVNIITNTVNVTNITYNNSVVYNYGPDYATLSRYSVRPIQRLRIERENVSPLQAVRNGSVTKVQGNTLLLAAPQRLQKAAAQAAPRQVKARIQQPKVEKGWAALKDPNAKAQLEQKYKTENAKSVPQPNIAPRNGGAGVNAQTNAPPQQGNAAAPAGNAEQNRAQRGKNRQGRGENANAGAAASPATSPARQQERGANATREERNAAGRRANSNVNAGARNPQADRDRERQQNARGNNGNGRDQRAAPSPSAERENNASRENRSTEPDRAAERTNENANRENAPERNGKRENASRGNANREDESNGNARRQNNGRAVGAAQAQTQARERGEQARERAEQRPVRPQQAAERSGQNAAAQVGQREQQERREAPQMRTVPPAAVQQRPAVTAPGVRRAGPPAAQPASREAADQNQRGQPKAKQKKKPGEETPDSH